jgi:glycosyltransferase involved in cell wall biosynthesis
MINVAHINLSPLGKGGIERLLVEFFRYFQGHDIQNQFCILDSHNEMSRALVQDGCVIESMERSAKGFDWRVYSRLLRYLRRSKPDIVHIHGNPGLMFGVPAALCAGIKNIVYTCHFSRSRHSRLRHRVLGSLLNRAKACIAVSQAAKDVLVEHYHQSGDRIRIIHNGVDTKKFVPSSDLWLRKELTVGFCGVFRPEKQIPLLISSVAPLLKQGKVKKLLLVGDGPEMDQCRRAATDLGVQNETEFAGAHADVRPYLRRMDIFVLPSREEAMPVALLEAMSHGCAVVGSQVGGIPEVIEDGVSGLVIPEGNEAALTSRLCDLANDEELRHRYGRAARQRVEDSFSLDAMMDGYAQLYREVASPKFRQQVAI